jgi:hypothetical protein
LTGADGTPVVTNGIGLRAKVKDSNGNFSYVYAGQSINGEVVAYQHYLQSSILCMYGDPTEGGIGKKAVYESETYTDSFDVAAHRTAAAERTDDLSYIGYSSCKISYDDSTTYYKINNTDSVQRTTDVANNTVDVQPGATVEISQSDYTTENGAILDTINSARDGEISVSQIDKTWQYIKIDNCNIIFEATATVKGKTQTRRCVLVRPTDVAEEEWILPAELGSNQIFANKDQADSLYEVVNDSVN